MKQIITSALIILLTIGAAQAQTTSKDQHQGHRKEEKLVSNNLNLTAEQKVRVKALREDHKKQHEELKNNTSLSAEAKESKRKELRQQYANESKAILTPEQREQQAKMKEEFNSMHQGDKNKGAKDGKGKVSQHGARRNGLQQELALTADQQQKVTAIRSSYKTKQVALRNDTSLSIEQRKTKMSELMKQQQVELNAVLTAEQIQKMEAHRGVYSKRKNK